MKTVVNLGSGGIPAPEDTYPRDEWREIRVDLDEEAHPDVLADVRDMPLDDGCADAIYASHLLEHIPEVQLVRVLSEWRRLLAPNGELLLQVPDIQIAAEFVAQGRGCVTLYHAPSSAGTVPIRPLDLIYGHGAQLTQRPLMSHMTGFTAESLGWWLDYAGFTGHIRRTDQQPWNLEARVRANGHAPDDPTREVVLMQNEERPQPEEQPEEQSEEQPQEPAPSSQASISDQAEVSIVDPDE